MRLPDVHPQRLLLNDEVHARPSPPLRPPVAISYVAMLSSWLEREREWQHVSSVVAASGRAPPPAGAIHFSADLGSCRLIWERHTEFTRYTIIAPDDPAVPFARPALLALPPDWLAGLPGQLLVAAHVVLLGPDLDPPPKHDLARDFFAGNVLLGSSIAGGAATALTDLRIHGDGCSRFLLYDHGMTSNQAGRMVQRLLEMETYRMMALLALPVARDLAPQLVRYERELTEITALLTVGADADEPVLLDRLTRLEAAIDNREAEHHYRFSAAAAYYELVQRRISELREERIQGLQTFREFTERRLAPAMNTCRAVANRQASLSQRVSRVTQLLSTRVDLTRQQQNQALLESMNTRARQQLRLQTTVEGLSIAAASYYILGLLSYLGKAVGPVAGLEPDLVLALSVPVVIIAVALAVRRIRRAVTRETPLP